MIFRPVFFVFLTFVSFTATYSQSIESYHLSSDTTVNRLAGTKRIYFAAKTDKRPKIDGQLNDLCWERGAWAGGFVQQIPEQGQKPSQKTEVKILYDENSLFVAFRCYDHGPGEIRPILNRRDIDEGAGDIVGIAFDSYHDLQTAYEFNVTAAGQKIDMVHLGAYDLDYNWDAVWNARTQVYDSLWTAEMQIPFSQIRFAPDSEQVWGLHVWRWIDRYKENSQWKLIPVDAPAMVYLFGELKGINGIKPKTSYEFLPYLSTKFSPNSDLQNKFKFGAGLDGKIRLNSGVTLDYAINPDFGQVEADPSVLNLTSYEVFNDEKRPFFLEGNTILDYSIGSNDILYYSRRIGHEPSSPAELVDVEASRVSVPENTTILSALKFTGKTKKGLSMGFVQSFTDQENATFTNGIYRGNPIQKMAVEPFTNYMVGRVKQDLNGGNTVIGGIVTSTMRSINDDQLKFLPNSSTVAGIDFEHNWRKRKYYIDFKAFYTDIRGDKSAISRLQTSSIHYFQRPDADYLEFDPDRTQLSGWGGYMSGGKRSGKFRAIASVNWRSPGVDFNDLGYIYQADLIQQIVKLTYKVSTPRGIIRSYYGEFTQEHDWSFGQFDKFLGDGITNFDWHFNGQNTLDRLNLHGFVQFKNLWQVHLNLRRNFNIYDTRELRGGPRLYKSANDDMDLYIQTNTVKDFWAGIGPRFTWYDDQISKASYFTVHLKWQISDRLNVVSRTVWSSTRDNDKYVTKVTDLGGNTQYLTGIIDRHTISSTLRFEYFVSPEISIQYYGNPYASVGHYSNFREVNDASARSLEKRYKSLTTNPMEVGGYRLTSDEEDYSIRDYDFNFQEFRSNLVGRWEFKPGSTIYLVWTNTRSVYSDKIDQSVWDSFGSIWSQKSENVFMIKFSYWFSL